MAKKALTPLLDDAQIQEDQMNGDTDPVGSENMGGVPACDIM